MNKPKTTSRIEGVLKGVSGRYWHSARRRPRPVRRLSRDLQAPRRPARALLRARASGRRDRAHHLRPFLGLLRRPDREEAAQPLPAGHARALVRHRRLQPRLQVLPELGHLASRARSTRSPTEAAPEAIARAARGSRLPRVAFTYNDPGHLRRVRDRRRRRLPRSAASRPSRSPPATSHDDAARASSTRTMDAANVDLKAFTEDFYRKLCSADLAAGPRHARATSSTRPTSGSRSRRC